MEKQVNIINNLHKYGPEFQIKCISSLLSDRAFLERILDILLPEYFEADSSKWIVEEISSYFLQYKDIPTMTVFKVRSDSIQSDILKKSVVDQLRNVYQKISDTDINYVKETFLNFCKNQSLKNAMLVGVEYLKTGEYEKIRSEIDRALKAGAERNLGTDFYEDSTKWLSDLARICVKTGWPLVDTLLDGGVGLGELGVIISSSGGGKCVGPNTEIELFCSPYHKRNIHFKEKKKITLKELFKRFKVGDYENAIIDISKEEIYVISEDNIPRKIITLFRTEKLFPVISYFDNGVIIKTSGEHLFKVNGEWKKVNDINIGDKVKTKTGESTLIKKRIKNKEEVLYDISVDEVHCYYSNDILSHNSWCLSRLGAEAMMQGKNVLHVTLELNENYVNRRYASCFTGFDFQSIPKQRDIVEKRVADMKNQPGMGKLKVKYYPLKTVSAISLKSHLERCQMIEGIKYDLMIVDYGDILKPISAEKNSNSYSDRNPRRTARCV